MPDVAPSVRFPCHRLQTMDLRPTESHPPRAGRWYRPAWLTALGLWLTPLIAMAFTDEVNWSVMDFLVFGAILLAACGAIEWARQHSSRPSYLLGVAVAVAAAFLLVMAQGAVGLLGDGDDPLNLLFMVAPAIAVIGSGLVRGRARPMSRVMAAAALLHALAGLAALAAGWQEAWIATAPFVGLWLLSAWLLRLAKAQP